MLKNLSLCFALIVTVAILVLSTSPVLCAERDHDGGFFLRLAAGGGPAGSEIKIGNEKMKLDGVGFDLEIAIGGIVAPNLALHGTLFGWMITDPDAEVDLTGLPPIGGSLDGDFSLNGFGGGVTYFFMPVNMYLTGTLGFGQLSLDLGAISGDSDTGFCMEAAVGKEWFVSDRWGIGLAVGITYHTISDPDVSANWSGISIPVRFSATFN